MQLTTLSIAFVFAESAWDRSQITNSVLPRHVASSAVAVTLEFQVRVLLAEVLCGNFSPVSSLSALSSSPREVTCGPDTPESISTS